MNGRRYIEMIGVKERQFNSELKEAIQVVQKTQKDKLFSYTEKIDPVNFFSFLERAKKLNHSIMFWASADEDLQLAGAGQAFELSSQNTKQRYQETITKWTDLLNDTVIFNPFKKSGTGVVSFGGFSFNPEKQSSSLWESFPESHFTVPCFVLSRSNEDYYLTINSYIQKEMSLESLADKLWANRKQLLEPLPDIESSFDLHVISKKEIMPDQWKETIKKATGQIRKTAIDKIVLAREIRLVFNQEVQVPEVLQKLVKTQTNCYVFAYELQGEYFVGATPERLVKVKDKEVLSTCLAGTTSRGSTPEKDEQLAKALFEDRKNRKEHDYVVKMIRSTIEKFCEDVEIPDEPVVHQYKTLQHLYTPVQAKLKFNHHIFSIIEELHPTPAVGGTPRKDALAFIRDNELLDRGWYGAPIGWIDSNHNGEFAVALRSALIQHKEASLFAGCGIVEDSLPETEYEETKIKLMPMLSVLGVD